MPRLIMGPPGIFECLIHTDFSFFHVGGLRLRRSAGAATSNSFQVGKACPVFIVALFCFNYSSAPVIASTAPEGALLEKNVPPKEESAKTCGPLISDTCVPIDYHKASLQVLWAVQVTGGKFNSDWHRESAGGDFVSVVMPVKFTYGLAKNLEVYAVVPYIHNFANNVEEAGPEGERSANFGGVGDISLFAKYLLLEETAKCPAVAGVFGVGFPTGNASNLSPARLGTDAIGSGAFTFTTGFNLYKWFKPILFYSNIWFSTPVNIFSGDDSVRSRDFFTFNLAAEYPLTERWAALMEFYSTWTTSNVAGPQGTQSPSTVLGILPGIEMNVSDKWSFAVGTAIDLAGKETSIHYTPMLTVNYSF